MTKLKRRATVLLGLCLILCTLLGSCGKSERPGKEALHVLLFTFDGLRSDHVSSLGYFKPTTAGSPEDFNFENKPQLDFDVIADRGVQFPNCFTPTNVTHTALASLLSGSTPDQGFEGTRLPEAFQAAGFHTIASVAGGDAEGDDELSRGFDVFEEHARDKDALTSAWLHSKVAMEDEAVERMFVWIHLSELGPPFMPEKLPDIITSRDLANTFADPNYVGLVDGSVDVLERANGGELPLEFEDKQRIIAGYDGQIARAAALMRAFLERWVYTVEDDFGTYVDALHEDPRWGRTLVVGLGVGGVELGEHEEGFARASTLHDSSLRVPLFFSHSDSLTGQRLFSNLVELADVAPTLFDWFGLGERSEMNGRSLLSLLDTYERRPFPEKPMLSRREGESIGVRTEDWRLLRDEQTGEFSLFELGVDPREQRDVASSHLEVVESLRGLLED